MSNILQMSDFLNRKKELEDSKNISDESINKVTLKKEEVSALFGLNSKLVVGTLLYFFYYKRMDDTHGEISTDQLIDEFNSGFFNDYETTMKYNGISYDAIVSSIYDSIESSIFDENANLRDIEPGDLVNSLDPLFLALEHFLDYSNIDISKIIDINDSVFNKLKLERYLPEKSVVLDDNSTGDPFWFYNNQKNIKKEYYSTISINLFKDFVDDFIYQLSEYYNNEISGELYSYILSNKEIFTSNSLSNKVIIVNKINKILRKTLNKKEVLFSLDEPVDYKNKFMQHVVNLTSDSLIRILFSDENIIIVRITDNLIKDIIDYLSMSDFEKNIIINYFKLDKRDISVDDLNDFDEWIYKSVDVDMLDFNELSKIKYNNLYPDLISEAEEEIIPSFDDGNLLIDKKEIIEDKACSLFVEKFYNDLYEHSIKKAYKEIIAILDQINITISEEIHDNDKKIEYAIEYLGSNSITDNVLKNNLVNSINYFLNHKLKPSIIEIDFEDD